MNREISIAQVIEAMEKGGYTQGFFHLLESDSSEGKNVGFILNACAIGQAALNLGVEDVKLSEWLSAINLPRKVNDISSLEAYIVYLNDQEMTPTEEIAATIKKKCKSILNKKETFETYEWNNTNYQGVKL